MTEIWKDVLGYEGLYQISNFGRVKSLPRTVRKRHGTGVRKEKILQGGIYPNGYKFVCLCESGEKKMKMIHRLVAEAFISNPLNFPTVNHIDGNKLNNHVENLEWCTQGENLKHAIEIGLVESQCKIRRNVTVECGEHIVTFKTMSDCSKFFGFGRGWLNGQIRKHGCSFDYGDCHIEVHERECSSRYA